MTFPSPLLLLVLLVASSHGKSWLELSAASLPHEVTFGYEPSLMVRGSSVICTENGVFPLLDSCEDYYHCSDWDGRRGMQIYHFTCPQGTIFEDRFDNCHSPTVGITRPGCENVNSDVSYAIEDSYSVPFIERRKRSLPPEENCTREYPEIIAEVIAESAKDTCILIYHVDKYVSLVRAMVPVNLPEYVGIEIFTTIVDEYNKYLAAAQQHSYVWRNGDDIMSGIRRTYELAQLFAPEFERKHEIMEKRVADLQGSSEDSIMRTFNLEMEIESLMTEKANITEMVSGNDIPKMFQKYFLDKLKSIDADIERKEKELSESGMTVTKTLKELITFMEFVKVDAGRIEAKANSTRTKVKSFKDHVAQDKEGFDKSKKMANKGIKQLEIERNASLVRIADTRSKLEAVERKREKERDDLKQLENEIDQALDNLQNTLDQIDREKSEQLRRHRAGQTWMILPIIGWIVGGIEMSSANKKIKSLLEQKKSQFESFDLKKKQYDSKAKRRESEIALYWTQIEREESKLEIENEKLHKLSFVDDYLEFVIDDADLILPFITRALVSLELIEEIFDDIVRDLGALISRAKTAKTELEMQNIQYIIYEGLSDMKQKWNASYANIISLGRCTHDDFYHILTQPPEPTTTTTEIPVNNTDMVDPLFYNTDIVETGFKNTDIVDPLGNNIEDINDYNL